MSRAYYNEIDPKAAAWLRDLIKRGLLAPGDVDERDIWDVRPEELVGYSQYHWFAGIGVWSFALRQAGWPDDRPVWTGSCPCQPFSTAGKGGGFADDRHLWPAWFWLIHECRPGILFGEQVASRNGLAWLDLVQADLEGAGYAVGALDLCAAGFGAPHIRQRLWFVAEPKGRREQGWGVQRQRKGDPTLFGPEAEQRPERSSPPRLLGDAEGDGRIGREDDGDEGRRECASGSAGQAERMGHASEPGAGGNTGATSSPEGSVRGARYSDGEFGGDAPVTPGPTNGFWRDAEWIWCRDEKWRPTEPGTFPLASGAPARVVRLRGYGNAINSAVAGAFVRAYMDTKETPEDE